MIQDIQDWPITDLEQLIAELTCLSMDMEAEGRQEAAWAFAQAEKLACNLYEYLKKEENL